METWQASNGMPVTKGAKKAQRASKHKQVFNLRRKDAMKVGVKSYRQAPTEVALAKAFAVLDKAAKRGVIKKGTANRKKSRLFSLLVSK